MRAFAPPGGFALAVMVKFVLPSAAIGPVVTFAVTMRNRDKDIQRRGRAAAIKILVEVDLLQFDEKQLRLCSKTSR
jgi:hypothetical protein